MYLHVDYGGKRLWYAPTPWQYTSITDPQVYSFLFEDWTFYINCKIPRFPKEMKAEMVCTLW